MKVHINTKNLTLPPSDTRILDRRVQRLRRRLGSFDPDLLQLDVSIEKHARKPEFTGSVRLFVVNTTLTARRNSGATVAELLNAAFGDIEVQLDRFKADLRGDGARRKRMATARAAPVEVPAGS